MDGQCPPGGYFAKSLILLLNIINIQEIYGGFVVSMWNYHAPVRLGSPGEKCSFIQAVHLGYGDWLWGPHKHLHGFRPGYLKTHVGRSHLLLTSSTVSYESQSIDGISFPKDHISHRVRLANGIHCQPVDTHVDGSYY